MNDFMQDIQHEVLDEESKEFCDSEITTKEMSEALIGLNNKSAPGSDGLTADSYKVFWKSLKMPLYDSFTQSIEQGQLSTSQRRGIITLIHKGKDPARENINNWRPITVTNVDYKILTKLLARRLQGVMKKIVHENQSGFIKGRNITTHIRLLDDLIKYADNEQLGGIVVSLDYKKAFDTIDKECIVAALKKFNFGAQFIKFISTILSKTESAVKNGGWLSEWFQTDRGVRQGCCVSPLLFVLVVELLAKKIRHNEEIKGILKDSAVKDDLKLLQYADDMTLLLKHESDLKEALAEIDKFSKISGLKLNKKKSLGMWVGSHKNKQYGSEEISWIKKDENIKILGIFFSTKSEASNIPENWTAKIEDIQLTVQR